MDISDEIKDVTIAIDETTILEMKAMIALPFRSILTMLDIENTSWKVLAYGIYVRVVDVSEIERVSAANE